MQIRKQLDCVELISSSRLADVGVYRWQRYRGGIVDYRVKSVIEIIQRDPARKVDWLVIAASVGLSPSGLRLLFRTDTGHPPAKYLKKLRLERARALLCDCSKESVKEIMVAVGFSDESHFVRDFAKAYGDTPARYRRRQLDSVIGSAGESANEL